MSCPRRSFIASAGRAVSFAEITPWCVGGLPAADSKSAVAPVGLVRVTLTDYPALANVLGSVQVTVSATAAIYPIILTRLATNSYAAVSSECTHSGCVVNPFTPGTNSISCSCHGSEFTAQGVVLTGPAEQNLTTYPVRQVSATVLEIQVPGIGFIVVAIPVDTSSGRQLRLTFPTDVGSRYEVRVRSEVTGTSSVVNFSLTETGVLNQTTFNGTGAETTLWVDASFPAGFLSAARF